MSTNFEAKGGPIVLAAFQELRQSHPDASLVIVGDRPNLDLTPGVRCTGFLRKEVPREYQQFREIIAAARAVVSATTSDICPLLFVEAAYFGCPVISTRRFAIPEIVDHGRTGFLLDCSQDASGLAQAMCRMLNRAMNTPECGRPQGQTGVRCIPENDLKNACALVLGF